MSRKKMNMALWVVGCSVMFGNFVFQLFIPEPSWINAIRNSYYQFAAILAIFIVMNLGYIKE